MFCYTGGTLSQLNEGSWTSLVFLSVHIMWHTSVTTDPWK